MTTAVVFDSAGTLLKVYRVARDVVKGEIVENVVSTNMVVSGLDCALVALRIESLDRFEKFDPNMLISDFVIENNIGLDVICRGTTCGSERIYEAVKGDRTATIRDLIDAKNAVKNKCKDIYYVNIGLVVDVVHRSVLYVLATGGRLFPGVKDLIKDLMAEGAEVYIASGDNRKSLLYLAEELNVPGSHVYDAVNPAGKKDIVVDLKSRYDRVIMVGDGINDRQAFQASDLGVLTIQQGGKRPDMLYDSADLVIDDIRQVESIVRESLHMIKSKNIEN